MIWGPTNKKKKKKRLKSQYKHALGLPGGGGGTVLQRRTQKKKKKKAERLAHEDVKILTKGSGSDAHAVVDRMKVTRKSSCGR